MPSAAHPVDRAPGVGSFDRAKVFARVQAAWKTRPALAAAEPELEAACAYAAAKYRDGRDVAWSVVGEAVAAAHVGSDDIVELWLAEGGARAALDALVAERSIDLWRTSTAHTVARQGPASSYVGGGSPGSWRALRAYLCVATPGEYDAMLAHVGELRRASGLSLCCALSYLFPLRQEWSMDDARRALKPPPPVPPSAALLFGSLTDVDLLIRLIEASKRPQLDGLSVWGVHRALVDGRMGASLGRIPERADEVLAALFTLRDMPREAIAHLHPAAPSATTRVMARLVGDAQADGAARAFLEAHPEDAMTVLADELAHGRRRPVLGPLLSVLVATHRETALALAGRAAPAVARALVAAGATEELVTRAAAKKLARPAAALRDSALSEWLAHGGSARGARSVLRDLAADDAQVPRLVRLLRASAADALPFAIAIVDALAEVGSEACLLELALLATKPSVASVGARAEQQLRSVLGLSDEDIADLAVPRTKPSTAAREAQARRLEAAMVEGRRWTSERFARSVASHPLLGELARGLVWGVFTADDSLREVFRLVRAGELRDARGAKLALAAGARIGIPHLLELEASHVAWARGAGLGRAPFEQIERAGPGLEEADELRACEGPLRQVRSRLESSGWRRDAASAGDGSVDYFRVVRGCAIEATLVETDAGPLLRFDGAMYLDVPERARRIAISEGARDVVRAAARTPPARGRR
jgi:hypothetical protein